MLSLGSIWKLYVVLAVITLVSLPAVELAQVKRHAFSRRDAPKDGTPAQDVLCGDNWRTASSTTVPADQVSCRGYDGLPYFCLASTCHFESKEGTTPENGFSLSDWRFKDCLRYPNPGETAPSTTLIALMSPIQIWAHNHDGYLLAMGWDDPNNKITRLYKCSWADRPDTNNQRPMCGQCTHQEFKDIPEPIPPPT
ncbi:hypothetical protein PTTG_11720 [Puccinia triticina 1-1 BBBD Race 1]|uniref:Secreted protein n=2 Tax=Puccinia triticina TaxID=208348 RepID=A0A180H3S0_PUCT1|nr:uncharacterized protein PtA15_2A466 [Puccinia triticina]OAV99657.1 hypothetical protein PTTG_11720 [Puccinia triticina 1-1 BBBD Race 1]WAQ82151.1 hypothetical protein PtA15_2A466 [Puccinia triticina]WAR53010.1 hypothetical protein PtB15_2B438 [Puccinia triticina]